MEYWLALPVRRVSLANRLLMASVNVDTSDFDGDAEQLRKDAATVIFAAIDGVVCGLLALADPIKETTAAAIAVLQKDGIWESC
jgi:Cu+-exporting ATPase